MNATQTSEIAEVFTRVQTWPAPMRVALARRILETLESPPVEQPPAPLPRSPSAAEVAATFKTKTPVPSAEECQRILEDELLRKYGS